MTDHVVLVQNRNGKWFPYGMYSEERAFKRAEELERQNAGEQFLITPVSRGRFLVSGLLPPIEDSKYVVIVELNDGSNPEAFGLYVGHEAITVRLFMEQLGRVKKAEIHVCLP